MLLYMRSAPSDTSRRILSVIERSISWRKLGIIEEILRRELMLQLLVHLIFVRIRLSLIEKTSQIQ